MRLFFTKKKKKRGSADITGASEEAALTGSGANSDAQGVNPAGGRWILTGARREGAHGVSFF